MLWIRVYFRDIFVFSSDGSMYNGYLPFRLTAATQLLLEKQQYGQYQFLDIKVTSQLILTDH